MHKQQHTGNAKTACYAKCHSNGWFSIILFPDSDVCFFWLLILLQYQSAAQ